jgi:hypothetical protein
LSKAFGQSFAFDALGIGHPLSAVLSVESHCLLNRNHPPSLLIFSAISNFQKKMLL